MGLKIALLAAAALSPSVVLAQTAPLTCVRGADERVIEVVAPGEIGAACDLRYTRDGGVNISVPYHANSNAGWCAKKAVELVENLEGSGFTCSDSLSQADAADESQVRLTLETDAPPVTAGAPPAAQDQPVNLPAEILAAEDPIGAPANALTRTSASAEPALPPPAAIAPVTATVTGEPVDLTVDARPATMIARPPAGGSRIVGAPPDPAPAVVRLATPAPDDRPAQPAATSSPSQPPAATAPVLASISRPATDIVRGVLAAQVAAWNEGDLSAFMAGYWNSPDLRFVSGGEVSKGWREVMKRYQARYSSPADMGRLTFSDLDVDAVTNDVAIVTGRFALEQPDETSSGAFTLVMKQFDGRWRIVHDHTVADGPSTK